MMKYISLVSGAMLLVGCASVATPRVPDTEALGVASQQRVESAPPDAAAIGKAMEEAQKPWKKKKDESGDAQQSAPAQQAAQGAAQASAQQSAQEMPAQQNSHLPNTQPMHTTFDRTRAQELAQRYTGAVLHTTKGDITVELYGADAPLSVGNFIMLAQDGFYNNLTFHRVIEGFMIQGGDPTGTGTGGPGYQFEDEINDHKVVRGALAMANAGPDTNGSQFFIVTAEATPWLDGKHTVFGRVTQGMDVVDAIAAVPTDERDTPLQDVVITGIDLTEKN